MSAKDTERKLRIALMRCKIKFEVDYNCLVNISVLRCAKSRHTHSEMVFLGFEKPDHKMLYDFHLELITTSGLLQKATVTCRNADQPAAAEITYEITTTQYQEIIELIKELKELRPDVNYSESDLNRLLEIN